MRIAELKEHQSCEVALSVKKDRVKLLWTSLERRQLLCPLQFEGPR